MTCVTQATYPGAHRPTTIDHTPSNATSGDDMTVRPSIVKQLGRRAGLLPLATALVLVLASCGGSSVSGGGGGEDGEGDGGGGEETGEVGPVRIGLLVPLSGVYAPLGEDMEQGFQLYLDQNDGALGGAEVELVTVDEGEGPDTGVAAATRLVTQEQVSAVVGIVNSATALGAKDTFVESEVPLIVANAGANDLTADASPYIWRSSFTNGGVAAALGAHVAEEVGDGSVYLISADYAAGAESTGGFRETFEAAGGTIAGEAATPFGTTTDWQPFLNGIRESGASAVYTFYAGAEAVGFVTQYNQFGLADEIPLYGAGFLTEGGVLEAQGEAALGVQTSLHYSDTIDSDRNREFVEAYQGAYDEVPTVYAVQAYDAATALDAAIESAGATDGESIAEGLGEVGEIDSPRGAFTFDENHDPDQPYYLREVQESEGGFSNAVLSELTQ
jgi:branched-chain amino acid transport system substrate-binding protein